MSYEPLLDHLRIARQDAGVSQRELSRRTGITQSHISQTESGRSDAGLPTVIQMARALDLELMLVPKKLVPAVEGIIGRRGPDSQLSIADGGAALKEIDRGLRATKKLALKYGESAELEAIAATLREMRRLRLTRGEAASLNNLVQTMIRFQASPQALPELRRTSQALRQLRNAIVHTPAADAPRPAYGLEEDDGEGENNA